MAEGMGSQKGGFRFTNQKKESTRGPTILISPESWHHGNGKIGAISHPST